MTAVPAKIVLKSTTKDSKLPLFSSL